MAAADLSPAASIDLSRPQVAPSLLSADLARVGEQVEALLDAGARIFHVDVMDGHFVPAITVGPPLVAALRDLVRGRGGMLDCHLMVEQPERQVEAFAEAGADLVTVHVEATPHVYRVLEDIRAAGLRAGVALNPGTPAQAVEPLAPLLDLCLGMTVNPGRAGQAYIPWAAEKLRRLRELLPPEVALQVDGGISPATIAHAAACGATVFVAGSSILGSADPVRAYLELAARAEASLSAAGRSAA